MFFAGAGVSGRGGSHEDGEPAEVRTPVRFTDNIDTSNDDLYIGERHADEEASVADVAINLAERSPRFEDPSGHANVTVQLGGTAFLNCRVLDLQDKTVTSALPSGSFPLFFRRRDLDDRTFESLIALERSRLMAHRFSCTCSAI